MVLKFEFALCTRVRVLLLYESYITKLAHLNLLVKVLAVFAYCVSLAILTQIELEDVLALFAGNIADYGLRHFLGFTLLFYLVSHFCSIYFSINYFTYLGIEYY